MRKRLFRFLKDAKGTTLIEYILIAALISVVMIVGLKKVGNGYVSIYNRIGKSIDKGEAATSSGEGEVGGE